MSRYVFDTNIVSLLLRRDNDVLEAMKTKVLPSDEIIGCPIVWFEVHRGLMAKDAKGQLKRFEQLFAAFRWQDLNRISSRIMRKILST
jgi:predicted nucleic acid-binding protein